MEKKRLFFALALPPHIKEALAPLRQGLEGARWVRPENLHVTLVFIGSAAPEQAAMAAEAAAGVQAPSVDIRTAGVECRQPDILWLKIEADPPLCELRRRLEEALARRGVDFDRKPFVPHVTLARMKPSLLREEEPADYLERHRQFPMLGWKAERFHLYESANGENGLCYLPLQAYPLWRKPSPC